MRKLIQVIFFAVGMLVFLCYYPMPNAEEPLKRRGRIIELEGSVDVKRLGSDIWRPAEIDMEVATGDLIRTLKESYVDISIEKIGTRNAVIRIREDSTTSADISSSEVLVKMITGKVVFWARKIKGELDKFEIRTPNTIVGIEGSLGVVEYDKQSETTESWVKVAGGYVINMNSGKYNELESGGNYIEVKERETSIRRDFRPEKYSWDLSLFRRNYAFVTRGVGPRVPYTTDYISGRYRTIVDVTEGKVIVAPYDEEGPRLGEGFVLLKGMQASMEEEIEEGPLSPVREEEEEEGEKKEKKAKEEEGEKEEEEADEVEKEAKEEKKAKEEEAEKKEEKAEEEKVEVKEGKKEVEKEEELELDETLEKSQEAVP